MSNFDWPSLERWLKNDPTCECCDSAKLNSEISKILAAAKHVYSTRSWFEGCISISMRLMWQLAAAFPKAKKVVRSRKCPGPFFRRVTRTWFVITTDCYTIELVARWTGPFRHQAVLLMPRCYRGDPFWWFGSTVIDLYWRYTGYWRPWFLWAGGSGRINKTVGRVRDCF